MKAILTLLCCACLVYPLVAQGAPAKKQTCCQQAFAEGKECKNKCCLVAHKNGESCKKCNPNKEDSELLKKQAKEKKEKEKK